ncbi:DUF6711 family protein [uncultured Eubacterium sp.]|uniref:DUF6711 family protein n=1 Tax=uncultured Eubacterium sp. TaxID=165185 RepID=UPI002614992E|nr:DUF6711 family protein [uncultured Eubacterium sp.]
MGINIPTVGADKAGMLVANSVRLPNPKAISWTKNDLDSEASGRDVKTGKMNRQKISEKVKLNVTWGVLNSQDMSKILKSIKGKAKTGEFSLQYFDAEEGANRTMTCYAGERTAPTLCQMSNGDYAYQQMTVNFIEC